MGYSAEIVAKIRRLHFYEHYSLHAVSKTVGLHRDTVKRLLYGHDQPPNARPSIVEPYLDTIKDHLDRYPNIRSTALLRILKDRGFTGSISTLRRFIKPLRSTKKTQYRPLKFIPGEQAQVDWAHFGSLSVAGGQRKLYLFVMVLSHSRSIYAEFTFDTKIDSFLRLHERAFEFLGGVSRKLLYDNMKTVVIERLGNQIKYNQQLIEFAGFYGFEPAVCAPYSGNQKGRVERAIRYIRDNFASGYSLDLIDLANRDLKTWLVDTANKRPWPEDRTKSTSEIWHEEKKLLRQPIPGQAFNSMHSQTARSSKTGLIRFDLNDYSIPEDYNRQLLTLEADDHNVRISSDNTIVCCHRRSWERGQRIINADHWRQQTSKKSHGHRDLLLQIIPELTTNVEKLMATGDSKHLIIKRFYQLYRLYGEESFRCALELAHEKREYRPEQVSKLLVDLETPTNSIRAVGLPPGSELENLHIQSHSLEQYDQF